MVVHAELTASSVAANNTLGPDKGLLTFIINSVHRRGMATSYRNRGGWRSKMMSPRQNTTAVAAHADNKTARESIPRRFRTFRRLLSAFPDGSQIRQRAERLSVPSK